MLRTVVHFVVLSLMAWVGLNLSLFGSSDRADKYLQDVVNTNLTRVLYPFPPHTDITVLLLTDHVLNSPELEGRWPASYDLHARVLKAVYTHQPTALFIDFMWLSQRPKGADGQFTDGALLIRQLKAYAKAGIPVFLAATPAVRENWKELEGLVTWVAVPLGFDVSDFVARHYPTHDNGTLTAAFAIATHENVAKSGFKHCLKQQHLPDTGVAEATPTPTAPAAFARCVQDMPIMDIVWSTRPNERNRAWMQGEVAEATLMDVALKGYAGVALEVPYTTTLFVRDLLKPVDETPATAHAELQSYLHEKIVLYGANLQGVNDLVFTPARTIQPGVYFHAMALDNLLNWGDRYKSEHGSARGSRLLTHAVISMIAVIPVILLCVLFHNAAAKLPAGPGPGPTPASTERGQSRVTRLAAWGRAHPYRRFALITLALLIWFGAVAAFEFFYLNYSASVVVGYVQVVMIGFFIEKADLLNKAEGLGHRAVHWLKTLGEPEKKGNTDEVTH